MAFSSVFPFLLPTHSVDCTVHPLLSHSRALLVSSALFHPFTALKCPFDGPFTALKCRFDGPFTALKCPFQMAPCPSENLGRTLMMDCVFATEYNRCSKKTTLLDYSRFISQNKDLATTGITQSACFMTFVNLFQLCDTHERQV